MPRAKPSEPRRTVVIGSAHHADVLSLGKFTRFVLSEVHPSLGRSHFQVAIYDRHRKLVAAIPIEHGGTFTPCNGVTHA